MDEEDKSKMEIKENTDEKEKEMNKEQEKVVPDILIEKSDKTAENG